ncbi:MAG: PD-(D/E)XK nuclease family protein [Chitinophagaceae bacterium]|nr:PD-(D/E)XK nuclease family protein [Chitinophagaceae bacterium]
MKPFLSQVAESLLQKFGKELFRVAIVFPNRRQAAYFREHLKNQLAPPALLPEMLTIEELVIRTSDYALADPMRQSIELYKAYVAEERRSRPEKEPMPFEDFYGLSQVLLNDIEEADAYCVNTENIFSLIADYKEIDTRFDELTDEQRAYLQTFWQAVNLKDVYQQRFAELWRLIPRWYAGMHEALLKNGFCTLGLMHRHLASAGAVLPDSGWVHVAFIGFNAFNGAQEKFIKKWQDAGLASLWLDTDSYYTENPLHEAGYFFRRNGKQVGLINEMPVSAGIPIKHKKQSSNGPRIDVYKVDGNTVQAKVIEQWLQSLPADVSTGKAAILLADEKLLLPVLQSLPANAPSVNITMGYPVAQSPLYSLLTLFFESQQAIEGKKAGTGALPWEVAMKWLNHPLNDWPDGEAAKLKEKIIKQGTQWVKIETLLKAKGTGSWLFIPVGNDKNLFTWLRNLLQEVSKSSGTNGDVLLQGLLSGLYDHLTVIESLYNDFHERTSLLFLKSFIMTPLTSVNIPFEAESTAGIQIMGLLESRGLDFENILLLGAGEGSLPRVAAAKTFIPYNLRKAFGLSTLEHQDAIFAYVFYRLLHRCKCMSAVYNGLITDNSTGEVSRFIKQLEHESALEIQHHAWQMPVKATASNEITIEKTDAVLHSLRRYYTGEKPVAFSPSAINKYLSCRLQFFLNYLAGIKKPDEMQTEIDAAVFGSAVHGLLQRLYNQWMDINPGSAVTEQAIDMMAGWIPDHLEAAIKEAWHEEEATAQNLSLKGFAAVISDVVVHFAQSFLEIDRGYVPFKVYHTEVSFQHHLQINTLDGKKRITLKGNIDRVDEKDGLVRMVDYKTGGDRIEFDSLDGLLMVHGEKQNKGALQTLLYALMFSKTHPEYSRFEPALVVLRGMKKAGNDNVRLKDKSADIEVSADNIDNYLFQVEEGVKKVIEEIFDKEVSFNQTNDLRVCSYCDYKGICGR